MARQESDREDLLREATALVDRAELRVSGEAEPVTVGFRRDGSLSVFFGGDPVYQFSAAGELRRAFVAGLLYKAERGRLVALSRERTPKETVLRRSDLDDAQAAAMLAAARQRLERLGTALDGSEYEVVGEVAATAGVAGRVRHWLANRPAELAIALRPNVG
jgi:hypothetical protein